MPVKSAHELAKIGGGAGTTEDAHAHRSRHKMRADWDTVRGMLTGAKPRRDKLGRDVFEVWADLVLENPPQEYERALKLFPQTKEPEFNNVTNNIGALYLQAVQMANRTPDPRIIEAGTIPVQPTQYDWD